MLTGDLLIRWTIRIAMLLYALTICGQLATVRLPATSNSWRTSRWLWTLGSLVFLSHVIAAFHFHHHWNHAHAIAETAEETRATIGWAFGEGIYFSYLFTLLWLADVAWWWLSAISYRSRPLWISLTIHIYLFFIAINGTVVFESGVVRTGGIVVSVVFALLVARCLAIKTSNTESKLSESKPSGEVE
ncbi:MAG: hypothetical protein ACI9G1_005213 [Pirellulaceae bacterium]|jgi:hypothetical protein